jgi:glycosyltransferase involved in cell wall biosynthesis
LARKNRDGVLRIFAAFRRETPSHLLFVGEPLSPDLLTLRDRLGLGADDVAVAQDPPSLLLEACYRHAFALLFPSRFEGFGWPVIEAQACGCPVLTTTVSALLEVAGDGACLRDPADEAGFAADLRALREPAFRADLIARGLRNAARFTPEEMVTRFIRLYEEILK